MKNILLTLATTAALMVGGMTFTDTADARPRGYGRAYYGGGYYGGGYRSYYPSYPSYGYGYRGYYGYPRAYYGYPRGYYGYPAYNRSGIYFSTPRAGFYFY